MTNRRVLVRQAFALLSAITGAIAVSSSWAQEAAPTLSEIIVTAQKREQNIQDVPISVIALSAQQLKDGGVTDIKNLQALTPGLTVTSTTSENVTTARIRGIGTVGDNPGLESSVGVVIDGVYRPAQRRRLRRPGRDPTNRNLWKARRANCSARTTTQA